MENIKYSYFLICVYILGLTGLLYEIFKSGHFNGRIYQVLMIIFWSICLFYKIRDIIKNKNSSEIDEENSRHLEENS